MKFNPFENMVGGFSDNDGTIDFYLRINSLLQKDFTVLDLGAGRAAWYEDDTCETRCSIRLLRGKVDKLIAADVDEAVLDNRASDEQIVIKDGQIKIAKNSVDIIIADYVLEHIEDPKSFSKQVNDCLKSGGWFCARAPHKYSYISLAASIVKNTSHSAVLKKVQPGRKKADIFPTKYKMNTLRDIRKTFDGWDDKSFIFRADPAYYFGSEIIYKMQSFLHRVLPSWVCGELVYIRKKALRAFLKIWHFEFALV